MDFRTVIARRRMHLRFTREPLALDTVDRITAAGLRAPSAGFAQGFALLALDDPDDLARFWACNRDNTQPPDVRRAPLVVVPFANQRAYMDRYAEPDKGWAPDEALWPVPYWYIDTGFAALLMLLAAVDEGLGALLFGIPRPDWPTLRTTFEVPEAFDPIGAVVVGHPADDPQSPAIAARRRPRHTQIHRGHWGR